MSGLELHTFTTAHRTRIGRLFARSGASAWEVSEDSFAAALHRSVCRRFPNGADPAAVGDYLDSLHVTDLGLACACRDGHPPAWDHFVRECRPALYAAARSMAGDAYRELADSLYAELFGLETVSGERRSLLTHYHGRSRLVTWLRSVLVQRFIDGRRAAARADRWDPDEDAAAAPPEPTPGRAHAITIAQDALDAAIAALDPRDRLRLRLYYAEDLTLAQIGRVTAEHEATVSRKLERARRELRRSVERHLRAEHGLSDAAIADCFEQAADAPEIHLTKLLSRAEDA